MLTCGMMLAEYAATRIGQIKIEDGPWEKMPYQITWSFKAKERSWKKNQKDASN